jgi:thiosulfate/3-mercaptopyruvate sulfurtransferase
VTAPHDSDPSLGAYAHPERLVTADWLQEHLDDPELVIVESDEDVLLYETGHIPGAVKIDWHTELQDPVQRDYLDSEAFAELLTAKGIARDHTVVFYGDNFNWWAAYALWVFSLFGHPDLRLLNGGRQKWVADGRELTTTVTTRQATDYPVVPRDDSRIRAFRQQVEAHLDVDGTLVDVRSPEEYRGDKLHMPDYPQEGALRGGHIRGAVNIPWKKAANEDGTFKAAGDLAKLYGEYAGLGPDDDIIAYCRIGERSSHTWFVLSSLLGYDHVRNYDGSWTEWGNLVGAPIQKGDKPR